MIEVYLVDFNWSQLMFTIDLCQQIKKNRKKFDLFVSIKYNIFI